MLKGAISERTMYNFIRKSVAIMMALFLGIGVPMASVMGQTDEELAGPESERDVQPVYYKGNPQADDGTNVNYFSSGLIEFRIQDVDSGTYTSSDGFLKVKIVVDDDDDEGPNFDWEIASGSVVKAIPGIFVKGGNGGNWYDYSDFDDVTGVDGATDDGYLHSPPGAGPNGEKYYGLSHISFGYKIAPDAYITIAADDTNRVGLAHTFTVTVWEDTLTDDEAGDFERASGETVTVTFVSSYGADTISTATGTTDSNGEYTVQINSNNAGQIKATASSDVSVDGQTISRTTDGTTTPNGGENSGPATKTYVDAKISIEADATNAVDNSHMFTITLMRDLGDGNDFKPFSGQTVTASLSGIGSFGSPS
ncbi:MAG: Ig-like domain-containing protein, partial [Thermoplasmata archaeon]|nr:Ig-like domain-containing protein [Thermoplasmata archaeon]